MNEADTCRTLITPKLRTADWTDEQIREQVTFAHGRIVPAGGRVARKVQKTGEGQRAARIAGQEQRGVAPVLWADVDAVHFGYGVQGRTMKRDMELARLILMRIEAQENYRDDISCEFEGYTEDQVSYHILLLHEAGLVVAMDTSSLRDIQWIPQRLTWQGHEFLESARDYKVWNQAKEIMAKTGGFAFEVAKPLLISLLKEKLGLPS